jgi:hypothetical protein
VHAAHILIENIGVLGRIVPVMPHSVRNSSLTAWGLVVHGFSMPTGQSHEARQTANVTLFARGLHQWHQCYNAGWFPAHCSIDLEASTAGGAPAAADVATHFGGLDAMLAMLHVQL